MKSTSAIITLFFSWSEEWFFCSSDLALGKKLFRRLLVFVLSALKHFLEGVPQTFLMCEMEGICRKSGGTIHHSRLVTKWKNCRLSLSVQLLQGCCFFFVFFDCAVVETIQIMTEEQITACFQWRLCFLLPVSRNACTSHDSSWYHLKVLEMIYDISLQLTRLITFTVQHLTDAQTYRSAL